MRRLGLIALAVLAFGLAARWSWGRSPVDDPHRDVVVLWFVGLVAVVGAAAARPGTAPWPRSIGRPTLARAVPVVAVTVVAGLARLVALGTFPAVDSDGIALAMGARDVLDGRFRDPFAAGWFGNPTFYFYLQAPVLDLLGRTVTAARLLGALVGTATVPLLYGWARRLFGHQVALAAAGLLALMPMHVYLSRISQNIIETSLFLVVVLWCLDRALTDGRPLDAAATGLALGFSQLFYFSGRVLPVVVVTLLCVELGRVTWHTSLRAAALAVGRVTAWIVLAAGAVLAPQLAHYAEHPETFASREATVSVLGTWGEQEAQRRGTSQVAVIADNVVDGLMVPFTTRPGGIYHPDPPLIGRPVAIPAAIGLVFVTATWWRRRHTPIVVGWWGPLLAIGLTSGVHAQRWAVALALVPLCAALGLDLVRAQLVRLARVPASVATALVGGAVVAIMVSGALFTFRDTNNIRVWSDANSVVASRVATVLDERAPTGTVVYTAFAPRMSFRSHPVVPFVADHVIGRDLLTPLETRADVPSIGGPTVFVFLPERAEELDVVRAVHPGGQVEAVSTHGFELYVAYWLLDP